VNCCDTSETITCHARKKSSRPHSVISESLTKFGWRSNLRLGSPAMFADRFSRAAVRWHGRYCREVNAGLEEAQAILATLGALRSPRRAAAAYALSDLISRRGLQQACEAVNRWARDPTH
jgi:hypothetical protein